MSRVSDYLKTAQPTPATVKPPVVTPSVSGSRVQQYLDSQKPNQAVSPVSQPILSQPKEKTSTIGKVFNVLLAPQRATSGLIHKGFESAGLLPPTTNGSGIVEGVKNKLSNIDTLTSLGTENKPFSNPIARVVTGQYTPTQSVWGNFWHELPKATVGTAADLILDPSLALGKLGVIGKATEGIGKGISTVAKSVAEDVPAVQKIGDALERLLVTRGGQSAPFKAIDRTRIIEESIAAAKVPKLVSSVIEAPRAIQQRVAQVLKGGITTNADIAQLAQPIRQEFDRVGASISKLAPDLLSPEKFAANEGKYLPRLYTTKEFPTDEVQQIERLFSSKPLTGPNARFKTRLSDLEFARTQNPAIPDVPNVISSIQEKVGNMVTLRKNDILALNKEISNLEKKGLRLALNKEPLQAFQELSANLETKTGSFFRKTGAVGTTGKPLFSQVPVKGITLKQPSLVGRAVKNNIERLIFAPDKQIETLKNTVGRRFGNINSLLDEIKGIRSQYASKIEALPSSKEIRRLADQARRGLGQIQEAGLPSLKGLTELGVKEQRLKAFDAYVKSGVPRDEAIGNLVQLPDNKGLGPLSGKFVPRADANAILKISKVPSPIEDLYNKSLSVWKTFKTAFSPATIARNDLTNFFILNPLGGVGPQRLDIYAKAINEMKTEGPLYQRAVKQGLDISTQQAAELTSKAKQLYSELPGVKKFFSTPQLFYKRVQDFYGSQDKFFKIANFVKGVTEDGLSDGAAMARAQFHLVDYSEVPQFVDWLRKSPLGIPFISFTYGVSKPLAKTLLTNPAELSKYVKILNGIASLNPTHDTKEKIKSEQIGLPDYQQGYGKALRLPFKDRFGRTQYLDLQYILPFNVLETQGITPGGNPAVALTADIFRNKSAFTGKPIWADGSDPKEVYNSILNYVQQSLLPPLAPGIPTKVGGIPKYGGSSLNKIVDAFTKRPEANVLGAKPRQIPQTLLETIGGIKTNPINPAQNIFRLKSNSALFNTLLQRIKSAGKNTQLSPAERTKEVQRLIELLKQAKQ